MGKHKFQTIQAVKGIATRAPGMVEPSLGGALCGTGKFRTPTTIIIFKLVTKPNMVEFVCLDQSWQKWLSYGWQDEKWSDKW